MPTDKLEQIQLSRTGYGGSAYTHQGWLTEDQRFFLVNDEGDEARLQASDANVDLGRVGPRCAGARQPLRRPDPVHRSQPLYSRQSRLRVELPQRPASPRRERGRAQGVLSEVGFFDIYPSDDTAAYNGAWSVYPFFASGSVAVNGIEQGLFVVRPRMIPRGEPTGLSVSITGPWRSRNRHGLVVRRHGREPRPRASFTGARDRNATRNGAAALGATITGPVFAQLHRHVRPRKPRARIASLRDRHRRGQLANMISSVPRLPTPERTTVHHARSRRRRRLEASSTSRP